MKQLNEQGRTLLEMLSVLAIIGVLTLGGIVGYQLAMTYYRANETVDEINRWAVAIAPQLVAAEATSGEEQFDISELTSPTRMGYRVDAALSTKVGYFDVSLYDVPIKVCERILSLGYTQPSAIFVVGWENAMDNGKCGEGETADMIFEFNKSFEQEDS